MLAISLLYFCLVTSKLGNNYWIHKRIVSKCFEELIEQMDLQPDAIYILLLEMVTVYSGMVRYNIQSLGTVRLSLSVFPHV